MTGWKPPKMALRFSSHQHSGELQSPMAGLIGWPLQTAIEALIPGQIIIFHQPELRSFGDNFPY